MIVNRAFSYLNTRNSSLIISYKSLRRLIGILGILLPLINILGGYLLTGIPIQKSISIYYYTNMRDFLVGLLFLVSLFLVTYKGPKLIDNIVTTLSGLAGLGVALFPCFCDLNDKVGIFQLSPITSDRIHLTCAGIFFISLAINSIFLFTRKNDGVATSQKLTRNLIYIYSGITILVCVLGIALSFLFLSEEELFKYKIILILEAFALLAFGISWLIKGETLFVDKH